MKQGEQCDRLKRPKHAKPQTKYIQVGQSKRKGAVGTAFIPPPRSDQLKPEHTKNEATETELLSPPEKRR